jgi:hypothetical protein
MRKQTTVDLAEEIEANIQDAAGSEGLNDIISSTRNWNYETLSKFQNLAQKPVAPSPNHNPVEEKGTLPTRQHRHKNGQKEIIKPQPPPRTTTHTLEEVEGEEEVGVKVAVTTTTEIPLTKVHPKTKEDQLGEEETPVEVEGVKADDTTVKTEDGRHQAHKLGQSPRTRNSSH